jgi:hypothetical protein
MIACQVANSESSVNQAVSGRDEARNWELADLDIGGIRMPRHLVTRNMVFRCDLVTSADAGRN